MDIKDKVYEYYKFYKKIDELDFIKYEIELDSTTHEVKNVIFDELSLQCIKAEVNVDEFIRFLILYFNVIFKECEKLKSGYINKFLEENCFICDICENIYTLEKCKNYNVYDIETNEFVEKIDVCLNCSDKLNNNQNKDENFLYKIINEKS